MNRVLRIALAIMLAGWAATAAAGVLYKQTTDGDYRTCYYKDGTKITTKTIHISQPCPINN